MAALTGTMSGVLVWCLAAGQAQPAPAARVAEGTKPADKATQAAAADELRKENAALKATVARLEALLKAAQPGGHLRPGDELRKLLAKDAAERQEIRDGLAALAKALKTAVENERAAREDIARVRRELEQAKAELTAQAKVDKRSRDELADMQYRFTLLQKRNTQLAEKLKKLTQQMQEMEKGAGTPSTKDTGAPGTGKPASPPKLKVSGLVKKVDYKNSLVMVSIGSDDGVAVGQVLVVFRGGKPPVYLGSIEIVAVEPDVSVGRISRQARPEAFRVGDRVAREVQE